MKYTKLIAVATLAFFASCTSSTRQEERRLPENPTNNQSYRDNNGNNWVWNAMMMYWVMSGTRGNTYHYYPSSGQYTNASGVRVTPPSSVTSGFRSAPAGKSSSGKAVFGSTGRSHSVSA